MLSDVNFGNAVYMIDRCTLQNQLDGSAYTVYKMWISYSALNRQHVWKTIVIQYWYYFLSGGWKPKCWCIRCFVLDLMRSEWFPMYSYMCVISVWSKGWYSCNNAFSILTPKENPPPMLYATNVLCPQSVKQGSTMHY